MSTKTASCQQKGSSSQFKKKKKQVRIVGPDHLISHSQQTKHRKLMTYFIINPQNLKLYEISHVELILNRLIATQINEKGKLIIGKQQKYVKLHTIRYLATHNNSVVSWAIRSWHKFYNFKGDDHRDELWGLDRCVKMLVVIKVFSGAWEGIERELGGCGLHQRGLEEWTRCKGSALGSGNQWNLQSVVCREILGSSYIDQMSRVKSHLKLLKAALQKNTHSTACSWHAACSSQTPPVAYEYVLAQSLCIMHSDCCMHLRKVVKGSDLPTNREIMNSTTNHSILNLDSYFISRIKVSVIITNKMECNTNCLLLKFMKMIGVICTSNRSPQVLLSSYKIITPSKLSSNLKRLKQKDEWPVIFKIISISPPPP
ncbi:hypothetical protein VP01_848g1 [Puccinia sorghi]|uniref:Uncharacterized protein n=1 Tax=Puccinia sorghi TaxID=27349 RepID=A0A0L6UBB9_9BASI|nr:hypothetical protein VP01_848g1 [Puccinia sorghi]